MPRNKFWCGCNPPPRRITGVCWKGHQLQPKSKTISSAIVVFLINIALIYPPSVLPPASLLSVVLIAVIHSAHTTVFNCFPIYLAAKNSGKTYKKDDTDNWPWCNSTPSQIGKLLDVLMGNMGGWMIPWRVGLAVDRGRWRHEIWPRRKKSIFQFMWGGEGGGGVR